MIKEKKDQRKEIKTKNLLKTIKIYIFCLLILAINWLVGVNPVRAQLRAEDIIEKSLQAQGGREILEKIKDAVVTASCKIYLPQGEILVERKIYSKVEPYKLRIEQNMLGMQVIIGYDGEKTWLQQMNNIMIAPETINNSIKASAARENLLLNYKKKGYKAEYLGESQVENKRCHQIKIFGPEIGETIYYFDLETHWPIKAEYDALDETGQKVRTETLSFDFRPVDKVMAPWKTIVFINGKKSMEIMIQEIKFNQNLEDALFAMPEKTN
ncbi:MAG: hypothetical protein N3B16_06295 [Candidatus Aminicenantes bacterium]|nr:hypothetical protein [Candidatus Aminicenantes bacterium]